MDPKWSEFKNSTSRCHLCSNLMRGTSDTVEASVSRCRMYSMSSSLNPLSKWARLLIAKTRSITSNVMLQINGNPINIIKGMTREFILLLACIPNMTNPKIITSIAMINDNNNDTNGEGGRA